MRVCCGAGEAPVCNPKARYECASVRHDEYVRENKASSCNCPRQCRQLAYTHDISQAMLSDHMMQFARDLYHANETLEQFRYDHCSMEVGSEQRWTRGSKIGRTTRPTEIAASSNQTQPIVTQMFNLLTSAFSTKFDKYKSTIAGVTGPDQTIPLYYKNYTLVA